jgi:hypothetical protein
VNWILGWDSIAGAGWWSSFYFWASIVALIGLGISEVASHHYSERKDELTIIEQAAVQRRHDEDMASVQHDTAQANERAAQLTSEAEKARAAIANANVRAAEATQKAEEERLARVRLEARLAPRSMTGQEQNELTNMLRPFAGTSVDIFVIPTGTADTVPFSRLIVSVLSAAQWQIRDLRTANGGQFFVGIIVGRAAGTPSIDAAVDALVGGLNAAIDAAVGPLFLGKGSWIGSGPGLRPRALLATPPAPISITIGTKP